MKELAKLGVLSKSDEDILKKLIPDDPTEVTMIPGRVEKKLMGLQDILNRKLQNFMSVNTDASPEAIASFTSKFSRPADYFGGEPGTAIAGSEGRERPLGTTIYNGKKYYVYPNGDMVEVK